MGYVTKNLGVFAKGVGLTIKEKATQAYWDVRVLPDVIDMHYQALMLKGDDTYYDRREAHELEKQQKKDKRALDLEISRIEKEKKKEAKAAKNKAVDITIQPEDESFVEVETEESIDLEKKVKSPLKNMIIEEPIRVEGEIVSEEEIKADNRVKEFKKKSTKQSKKTKVETVPAT